MRARASIPALCAAFAAGAAGAQTSPPVRLRGEVAPPAVSTPSAARPGQVAAPGSAAPPVTVRGELETQVLPGRAGVPALLKQAESFRQRGRKDLAAQALERASAAAPDDPEVVFRRGLYAAQDGQVAAAVADLVRLRGLVPATDQRLQQISVRLPPGAVPPAPEPAAAPAAEAASPRAAPRAAPNRDPGAPARAAGFEAFNSGDLAQAERLFQQALRARSSDADAAGGLGVIRLRQRRFAEAEALLRRAASGAQGARWSEALHSARFYGGLEAARRHLDAGRHQDAEQEVRRLSPANAEERVEAQMLLGQALSEQRRHAEAEAAYRVVLQLQPDRSAAVAALVEAQLAQGQVEEASETLLAHPQAVSGEARARIERARAAQLAARGDTFGAGAALSAALAANPRDPWARLEYAKFLARRGEVREAAEAAAPLFASSDADPERLQAAALYAEFTGRYEEAAQLLARVPARARTAAVRELAQRLDVETAVARAQELVRGGRRVQAVSLLRGKAGQAGLPYAARSRLAQALLDAGDAYQAGALALAAAREPPPADARPGDAHGFLVVLAAGGQDQAARDLLETLRGRIRGPEDENAWRALTAAFASRRADQLRLAGDHAVAFDVLSAAFAYAPRDPGLLAALARLYHSGGLSAQAVEVYDLLLAAQPSDAGLLLDAARAATAAQDYGRAAQLLRRAQQLRPTDAELQFELGKLEQARGREREALKAFERADALVRSAAPRTAAGAPTASGALGANPFRAARSADVPQGAILAPGLQPPGAFGGVQPAAGPVAGLTEAFPSPAQIAAVQPAPAAPTTLAEPVTSPAQAIPPPAAPAAQDAGLPYEAAPPPPPPFAAPGPAPLAAAGPSPTSLLPRSAGGLAPRAAPGPDAPLPERIRGELVTARLEHMPYLEGGVAARVRSGEEGSSRLGEISARITGYISAPGRGRLRAAIEPVALSAGTPSGDGARRVGANPLIAAEQILAGAPVELPAQDPRSDLGAGLSLAYENDFLRADVGVTPLGFRRANISAGLRLAPDLGALRPEITLEQRPVTDSVLAYAGDRDPVTGLEWGSVVRQQVTAGLSGEFGQAGFYATATGRRVTGHNTPSNTGYEVNGGAYYKILDADDEKLQIGFNFNVLGYERNLRYFTLGHGGYFSPETFVALAAPITYTLKSEDWWFSLNIAPGVQSYREELAPILAGYPELQARLVGLAVQDPDIPAFYPARSRTGFGLAGSFAGEYRVTSTTFLGGQVSFDNFGRYSESRVSMYLRQLLGSEN